MRRPLALAAALAALLALPAGAAVRLGTPAGETLTGTHQADRITGDAGDDLLKGLAGNDTYHFADGWGDDTLEEKAAYRVDGKKRPGGRDTLSFAGVRGGGVRAHLVPEWRESAPSMNAVSGPAGENIDLGGSVVEDAVGGRGDAASRDHFIGGGAANRLATGGGHNDTLEDAGGLPDGYQGLPGVAASSDTFQGAAANTGTVLVSDFGGAADVLDLRPLRGDEVYLAQFSCDSDPEPECLQVVTGTSATSQVVVVGQLGPYGDGQTQGRIETVLFADGPVSFADGEVGVATAGAAGPGRDGEALLGAAETARQERLAKRAPALAEEARRAAADLAVLGEP